MIGNCIDTIFAAIAAGLAFILVGAFIFCCLKLLHDVDYIMNHLPKVANTEKPQQHPFRLIDDNERHLIFNKYAMNHLCVFCGEPIDAVTSSFTRIVPKEEFAHGHCVASNAPSAS